MAVSRALAAVVVIATIAYCANAMVPLPKKFTYGSQTATLSRVATFHTDSASGILQRAVSRIQSDIFIFPSPSWPTTYTVSVSTASDDENLQFGVDESYSMTIDTAKASISAKTIWGAMHGLQTFAQLVVWNGANYTIPSCPITVTDAPRFPWRGFMVDTARHFLDVATLKRQIDGMAASKLNVFHWHAVDAESFPVEVQSEPLLVKGAYSKLARYSHAQITDVVKYAKERGVRTIVEFDIPGHAASWGVGMPDLTVKCPRYSANINNIPLNPTLDKTWTVIKNLFTEMVGLFTDDYIHTGGDEVVTRCFENDPSVAAWMSSHGMTTGSQLYAYFEQKLSQVLAPLKKKLIVWEDVFNEGITIDPKTHIVHIWSNPNTLDAVTSKGINAITSAGWYLGVQIPNKNNPHGLFFDTWQDFFLNDPILPQMTGDQISRVLGGEAAQWGEQIDSHTIDAIAWPRTAAVAERLWSPKEDLDIPSMKTRLSQHWCLLTRRGISASPIMPGYCELPNGTIA